MSATQGYNQESHYLFAGFRTPTKRTRTEPFNLLSINIFEYTFIIDSNSLYIQDNHDAFQVMPSPRCYVAIIQTPIRIEPFSCKLHACFMTEGLF